MYCVIILNELLEFWPDSRLNSMPFNSNVITSSHPISKQWIHSVVMMNAMILNEGDNSHQQKTHHSIFANHYQLFHKWWSKVMQWVRVRYIKKIQCQYSTFFSIGHFLSHIACIKLLWWHETKKQQNHL